MKQEKPFCHSFKNIITIITAAVITLAISVRIWARDLEVVSFDIVQSDLTARTKPVRDLNDQLCALIKIAMPDIAKFEGAKETVYDFNEYLVYVPPGTKYLNIKTQGSEPLLLYFPDLGFQDGLTGGATYRLKLTGYPETSVTPVNTDLGANYLIMEITPKTGVSVKIDGIAEPLQNGQLMKLLKYGDHTYSVEAPDYEPVSGTITIKKGDKITTPIVLESLLGTLIMNITPESNASVIIDGKRESVVNGKVTKNLRHGEYTYSVEAPDYETVSGKVTIAKGDKITLPVVLESVFGSLIMNVTPESNASVIIDGKTEPVKNGKVTKNLRQGEYTYKVEAPGYDIQSGTVTIAKGKTAIVSINLESVMANLTVKTETAGANILINGQSKGTGSWNGELTPGVYEIEVNKEGYRSQKQVVDLAKKDEKEVRIPVLTPIYGVLNIAYQPIGADIYIDGNKVGTSPMVLNDILIGSHKIEIKKEGYETLSRNVTISENKPLEFVGELDKYEGFRINWTSNVTLEQKDVITNLLKNMVYVEGGSFMMGSDDKKAYNNEKPFHREEIESFHIGRYEVTQKEWEIIMGKNPSLFNGEYLPVEKVSWNDCQEFIKKLNLLTGLNFRLPSEAEWEYAARGGNKSLGYKYSGSNNLKEVGWYDKNSKNKTHPVGQKKPNELGLYDMSGNVAEWTSDHYSSNYNSPRNSEAYVVRGGDLWTSKNDAPISSRSHHSSNWTSVIGFRLAL